MFSFFDTLLLSVFLFHLRVHDLQCDDKLLKNVVLKELLSVKSSLSSLIKASSQFDWLLLIQSFLHVFSDVITPPNMDTNSFIRPRKTTFKTKEPLFVAVGSTAQAPAEGAIPESKMLIANPVVMMVLISAQAVCPCCGRASRNQHTGNNSSALCSRPRHPK